MGRAEEVYHAAQAKQHEERIAESERFRSLALATIPLVQQASTEFLQALEEVDYSLAPDTYDSEMNLVGWELEAGTYVFSDGVIKRTGHDGAYTDVFSDYEKVSGIDSPTLYVQSSVDTLYAFIDELHALTEKIE